MISLPTTFPGNIAGERGRTGEHAVQMRKTGGSVRAKATRRLIREVGHPLVRPSRRHTAPVRGPEDPRRECAVALRRCTRIPRQNRRDRRGGERNPWAPLYQPSPQIPPLPREFPLFPPRFPRFFGFPAIAAQTAHPLCPITHFSPVSVGSPSQSPTESAKNSTSGTNPIRQPPGVGKNLGSRAQDKYPPPKTLKMPPNGPGMACSPPTCP